MTGFIVDVCDQYSKVESKAKMGFNKIIYWKGY